MRTCLTVQATQRPASNPPIIKSLHDTADGNELPNRPMACVAFPLSFQSVRLNTTYSGPFTSLLILDLFSLGPPGREMNVFTQVSTMKPLFLDFILVRTKKIIWYLGIKNFTAIPLILKVSRLGTPWSTCQVKLTIQLNSF